jgi:predicted RNase H-like HicB family nuclease
MSGRSRNSEKAADPARPFDPDILRRAREIAAEYEIVVWFEDGEWYGRGLELPHTYGDGKTPAACIASVREGLVATVATMLEDGEKPPAPARAGERTEQVNIRLTPSERALLENRSRAGGFRGISDFVRAAALVEK